MGIQRGKHLACGLARGMVTCRLAVQQALHVSPFQELVTAAWRVGPIP